MVGICGYIDTLGAYFRLYCHGNAAVGVPGPIYAGFHFALRRRTIESLLPAWMVLFKREPVGEYKPGTACPGTGYAYRLLNPDYQRSDETIRQNKTAPGINLFVIMVPG